MAQTVLITGGAGFIGSHLARELLLSGYTVRVLDNLDPQVHGERQRPAHLERDVELCLGDVRDPGALGSALNQVDAVFHFAASVGVGQSMYRIHDYTSVNELGTACLLEALVRNPVGKLVVASSMSIYGEGRYLDADGAESDTVRRSNSELKLARWEPVDEQQRPLVPVPTPETKSPALESIYALNKYMQERSALIVGRAYNIPTVALRFFNVYGPHQALSNPYTGVLAIFASRLLNGNSPLIFEDGQQRRDFVHVSDVARACRLALERSDADGLAVNIGSGVSYSVKDIADRLAALLGSAHITPDITGRYRVGDIRHCFANIDLARERLGFTPRVTLNDGLAQLTEWLATQVAVDNVAQASSELQKRGLTL